MSPLLLLALLVVVQVLNMKAELVNTTSEFSGHKKVTADIDISRLDFRERA